MTRILGDVRDPGEHAVTRKIVDCRDVPSDAGCTLTISGQQEEVVRAAAEHAVSVHGHVDGDELRSMIRAGLRDAPPDPAPGGFVQLIEFGAEPAQLDEFDAHVARWRQEIGADRTAAWMLVGADRDRPGVHVEIVAFPSYDDAVRNSTHPATVEVAARLRELFGGEPVFRNLDVVRAEMPDR